MCSILCWILSIWEALGWKFCIFDSCISNKGEKFELEMACWMHLEGFQAVSSHFWALLCTSQTGRGHRSDQSECWSCAYVGHRSNRWWWPVWPVRAEVVTAALFQVVFCMHRSRGSCIGSGGACMCAGGALCGISSFPLEVCALCLSIVLSRMCRAVALS
jgi:hypothetical protein